MHDDDQQGQEQGMEGHGPADGAAPAESAGTVPDAGLPAENAGAAPDAGLPAAADESMDVPVVAALRHFPVDADGVSSDPHSLLSRRSNLENQERLRALATRSQWDERRWRLDHLLDAARNLRAVQELLDAIDRGVFTDGELDAGAAEADRRKVLRNFRQHLADLFEEVRRINLIDQAAGYEEVYVSTPEDRTVCYFEPDIMDFMRGEAQARDLPLETVMRDCVVQGIPLAVERRQRELEELSSDGRELAEAAARSARDMDGVVARTKKLFPDETARGAAEAEGGAGAVPSEPAPGDAPPEQLG